MRRAAALVLVLFLAISAASPLSGGLPPPPVVPQVRVELESVPPVDVDRDAEAVITGNGTVNVTVPSWFTNEIRVYFNVSVNNTFWFATIDPPSASFTGSHEVPFQVNVTVPGRVTVSAGAEIFVDANVSVSGVGKSWTASTPIPIAQYFGVAITPWTSSSAVNFSAHAGGETPFAFRIQNLGNGPDSFDLHVDNIAELQAAGVSVYMPTPVNVPAKVTANVNGNVSVPASLTTGNYTLSFSALSSGAAAKGVSVTSAGAKRIQMLPPDETGGGGGSTQNNTTKPKGFLPGPDAAAAVSATAAAAALVSWRRLRRP
jgi:methionine-rich copper-binding protein CopC